MRIPHFQKFYHYIIEIISLYFFKAAKIRVIYNYLSHMKPRQKRQIVAIFFICTHNLLHSRSKLVPPWPNKSVYNCVLATCTPLLKKFHSEIKVSDFINPNDWSNQMLMAPKSTTRWATAFIICSCYGCIRPAHCLNLEVWIRKNTAQFWDCCEDAHLKIFEMSPYMLQLALSLKILVVLKVLWL